jgi:alkanesulfonate monooxygenase SsuD/methylene tetrahydromethanopterin reductase-like flavin-dependent oxidoreductase (luciferase family)
MSAPRFGFFFWPWSPAYTARMASLGDAQGWDLVGIADTPGNAMDPWVALTVAAVRTQRVPLAACVTNLATRHPAITAGAAASVDAVSGGRMVLGLGTGHSGVVNVGAAASGAVDFREGLRFTRALLAGERASLAGGAAMQLPSPGRRVPVYAAASGPRALRAAGAEADGVFVNHGLQAEHVARARALIAAGASEAGRRPDEVDVWWIACLDVSERRDVAFDKLGSILGFVAAYVLGPDPVGRGVPAELVAAVREMRAAYTTRRADMDPELVKRLGLFDYLRRRLAVAGTPEDCVEQVRAALAAGATRLMFTVSLAADPEQTVELFGSRVLPLFRPPAPPRPGSERRLRRRGAPAPRAGGDAGPSRLH